MYDNGRKQQRFCIIKLTRFNDVQAGSTRNRGVSLGTMRMYGTRWTTRRVDRWERTCLSRVAPKYTLLLSFVAIIPPSIYLSMSVYVRVCIRVFIYRFIYKQICLHKLNITYIIRIHFVRPPYVLHENKVSWCQQSLSSEHYNSIIVETQSHSVLYRRSVNADI